MANAKISSQELILRNTTDSPANADSNSLRLYADGTNLWSIDSSGNTVNISAGSINNGEVNTASNLGSDASRQGLFSVKTGSDLQFKSLVPGTNITLTATNDEITINSSGGSGSSTFAGLTDTDAIGDEHSVLHVTGSGGTTVSFSNFNIDDGSGSFYHDTVGAGNVGKVDVPLGNIYGATLRLQDPAQAPTSNGDYCSVGGSVDTLIFRSTPDGNGTHNYLFQANNTAGAQSKLKLEGNQVDFELRTAAAQSSQEYDLPAAIGTAGQVLSLNTVNGTTGTLSWVNPASGGGSPGGSQYDIQVNDGSGGFATANWQISSAFHILPDSSVSYDVGGPSFATRKVFVGAKAINAADDGGLYLAKATNASQLTDYSRIFTDGTHGSLYFEALADGGNVHHYYLEDSDGSVELHLKGNGTRYWTLKTDSAMTQSQTLKLPQTMGTNGQVLALSAVSGDNADLDWTDPAPVISHTLINRNMAYYRTIVNGSPSIAGVNPTIAGGDNANLFLAPASYGSANTLVLVAFWPFVYKDLTFTSFEVGFANLGLQAGDTFDVTIELSSVVVPTAGILSTVSYTNQPGNTTSIIFGASQLSSLSTQSSLIQGGILISVEITNASASSSSTNPEIYFDISVDRKET